MHYTRRGEDQSQPKRISVFEMTHGRGHWRSTKSMADVYFPIVHKHKHERKAQIDTISSDTKHVKTYGEDTKLYTYNGNYVLYTTLTAFNEMYSTEKSYKAAIPLTSQTVQTKPSFLHL